MSTPTLSAWKARLRRTFGDDRYLRWVSRYYGARAAMDRRRRRWRAAPGPFHTTFGPRFVQALGRTPPDSDISDHLGWLCTLTVAIQAKRAIELGTRGGESTRSLLAGLQRTDGRLLSLDIDDVGAIELPAELQERWRFQQADDTTITDAQLAEWWGDANDSPAVDLIFLDTSHEYGHTCSELQLWTPRLRRGGLLLLHDTNMGRGVYRRLDGALGDGWDNQRGVIRALQEMTGVRWDENCQFVELADGWTIQHVPYCNGLTVLIRN